MTDPDRKAANDTSKGRDMHGTFTRFMLASIFILLLGWALHAMTAVIVPLVFALMTALIVAPLDRGIADRLPPQLEWLGRIAVMLTLCLVFALFVLGLVFCAEQLVSAMPTLSEAINDLKGTNFSGMMPNEAIPSSSGGQTAQQGEGWLADAFASGGNAMGSWMVDVASSIGGQIAGATGALLSATILVIFLVLLALSESATWQAKIDRLAVKGTKASWTSSISATASMLRRWLLVRTGIGVLSALLYTAVLWLFNVELLAVWALLTFLLNFIPNIGAVISGTLPAVYALATRDLGTAALIAASLFAIEQIFGNWLDPRIQGRQIAISPVVIFVALLVWGWIWGIPGAFLATPITICMMVVSAHIQHLRPFALLLSDEFDMKKLDEKLRI